MITLFDKNYLLIILQGRYNDLIFKAIELI